MKTRISGPDPNRRGFSLVEVLISVGVVSIGLFGVMALLPLAHHQAFVGSLQDRSNVAGRLAYKMAHIFEIDKPFRWVNQSGNRVVDNATLMGVLTNPTLPRAAFCIDPLYIAHHEARAAADKNANAYSFPYDGAGASSPRMPRITVSLGAAALGVPHAEEICRGLDDLDFEGPVDPLLPALQADVRHTAASPAYWDGATGNLVKRRTTGRFSWMLTMAPELGEETDLYTESAVVFYNRNFNIDAEEFAFDVAINSIGAGGGEITLRTRGHAREKLEIRPGCWLMLAAALQVRPPYAQGTPQPITHSYFRWYRVVNTAGDILEPGGGVFAREFTIVGPDWNVNALNQPQVAIVCPSAVAVFEKTTRLQTSSVWLPQ